jgi:hypothetical protein
VTPTTRSRPEMGTTMTAIGYGSNSQEVDREAAVAAGVVVRAAAVVAMVAVWAAVGIALAATIGAIVGIERVDHPLADHSSECSFQAYPLRAHGKT